jgi:fused signal recognition particle receptor
MYMVFDFLRDRTEEGVKQLQNIAEKAAKGQLGSALQDSAEYIKLRNKIDAENFKKLSEGLARTRERLMGGISSSLADESSPLETRLTNLEEVLLGADIGAQTSSLIINDLRKYARTNALTADDVAPVLRQRLIEALTPSSSETGINFYHSPQVEAAEAATAAAERAEAEAEAGSGNWGTAASARAAADSAQAEAATAGSSGPTVLFVIGANGMGKTTTIGKIAGRLVNEANQTVLVGACDTFRAAAVGQLAEWTDRANCSIEVKEFLTLTLTLPLTLSLTLTLTLFPRIISSLSRSLPLYTKISFIFYFQVPAEGVKTPVPVVKATLQRAKRDKFDVAIIDTSGRLSNNFELIEELKDMKAAIQEECGDIGAPHETLLVVDGSVGRNAVDQAAAWRKYVGVSGLVITKLDGTARAGFVVSVVRLCFAFITF